MSNALPSARSSLFHFVVRHLHWMAYVPLAPQFFDAWLLAWTAVTDRPRLRAMEALELAALHLPNLDTCIHRFGGIGFRCNRKEFAHLHGNGLLDVLLTRERAEALIVAGHAEPHHVLGSSAWVSYWVRSQRDVSTALSLIEEGAKIVRVKDKAVGVLATRP